MQQLQQFKLTGRQITRFCALMLVFLVLATGVFFYLRHGYIEDMMGAEVNSLQMALYTLGGGALLALIGTLWVKACLPNSASRKWGVWACPLAAAGLSLALMAIAYVNLGVYPVGNKSILMVDMHHQYAPLLSELRDMLIHGGSFTYSFHIGLGANFIPCFAYYLGSPLNLLLLFFSEAHLTEAILVITLLKNALAAAAFAACVQYLYRKRTAMVVGASVMYSLMLYMLAYSWNIMWLDVVALLPLVVMCFERMLREGKWLGYVFMLALALFSNYYIGFMLCMFLVLYFIVWLIREPRTLGECARGTGLFAAGSLLGGGLVMALLLPTAIALGRTSAAGDTFPDFASNFAIFDLLERLFYGATPTIRSGNLPNLYCGVLVVLLVPVYATQRSVPLRRRVCYVALLLVTLLSCTINQWDLLWHGLHTPNDLPYRFSFLACFVLLLMVARVLTHLTQITPKQILGSLTASAAYLVLWEKFGGESAPDEKLLYTNLLLLTIYALVLLITATRRMPVRAGRLLLLLVVTVELFSATPKALVSMDGKEYFTLQENYVDNDSARATALAVERVQELSATANDGFARLEFLPRDTCMDPALYHYNGITTFASSNSYNTTKFMGQLGFAVNGVNSYLYHSFVAPADSLLGLKYVILDTALVGHSQLALVDTVKVGRQIRYIYENTDALPIGYYADKGIADYVAKDYAPFDNLEMLYSSILGESTDIYSPLAFTVDSVESSIYDGSFMKGAMPDSEVFTGVVTESGQYFGYVDCGAADSIEVNLYSAEGEHDNSWGVTTYEPYIIDLGTLSVGSTVKVTITSEDVVSGNIHVVRLNEETYTQAVTAIAENGLKVTACTDTGLTGTITAPQEGTILLSVPYDRGWSATVDGKPAETFAVQKDESGEDGALLAVKVSAGEHTVVLEYHASGQLLGLVISLVCLLVIVVAYALPRIKQRAAARRLLAEQKAAEAQALAAQAVQEDTAAATPDEADALPQEPSEDLPPEESPTE